MAVALVAMLFVGADRSCRTPPAGHQPPRSRRLWRPSPATAHLPAAMPPPPPLRDCARGAARDGDRGGRDASRPAPKPAAELDTFKIFLGKWRCDGKQFARPLLGPEHAITGTAEGKLEADKFWQSFAYEEKKTKEHPGLKVKGSGASTGVKRFVRAAVGNHGEWDTASATGWEGDKLVWTGELSGPIGRIPFHHTFTKKGDKELDPRSLEVRGPDGKWVPDRRSDLQEVAELAPGRPPKYAAPARRLALRAGGWIGDNVVRSCPPCRVAPRSLIASLVRCRVASTALGAAPSTGKDARPPPRSTSSAARRTTTSANTPMRSRSSRRPTSSKNDPAFLYNLAQSYRLAGDAEQALHFYRTYLRYVPKARQPRRDRRADQGAGAASRTRRGRRRPSPPGPAGARDPRHPRWDGTPPPGTPPPPVTPRPAPVTPADRPPPPSHGLPAAAGGEWRGRLLVARRRRAARRSGPQVPHRRHGHRRRRRGADPDRPRRGAYARSAVPRHRSCGADGLAFDPDVQPRGQSAETAQWWCLGLGLVAGAGGAALWYYGRA